MTNGLHITAFAASAVLLGGATFVGPSVAAPTDDPPTVQGAEACPKADPDCSMFVGVEPLAGPSGARVYRETWWSGSRGWSAKGSITLTIRADGTRTLQTPWRKWPIRLRPAELADFEPALARSDFGKLPRYGPLSVCTGGVATTLEALVEGRYRIVQFSFCGVSSPGVADALDQLFVFAAAQSHLKYSPDPAHPTYRW
jgi:hypothetical protein